MASKQLDINGTKLAVRGNLIRMARLQEEWYQDLNDPEMMIESLRKSRSPVDVLNFWQRLPDTTPRHNYCMEHDSIAALPIGSYSSWLENQVEPTARNKVKKALKKGLVVRKSEFDDAFVQGMVSIFNETPVRQGKRFWHYGKNAETIRREFSRFLFREEIFGAYLGDELVGFIFLADAGRYAALGQIISKIAHRDKAPNNVLIAKAVERCAEKQIPYLVYAKWVDGSLGEFKRSNGFKRFDLPRYFVPLNGRGKAFVALKLHRGFTGLIPERMLVWLKGARRRALEGYQRWKHRAVSAVI